MVTVLHKIRHQVFLPFVILFGFFAIWSFVSPIQFNTEAEKAVGWVLGSFGWLFGLFAITCTVTLAAFWFSPVAHYVIGGPSAKPLISKQKWLAISICTILAAGNMFWGSSEPIYTLYSPPKGIEPNSLQAHLFALPSVFMNWSFVPISMYALPGMVFAIMHYNAKKSFSLGSVLSPILGDSITKKGASTFDVIMLFACATSLASSLSTGILPLTAGVDVMLGTGSSNLMILILTILCTVFFVASAVSGLEKGISFFSQLNMVFFGLTFLGLLFAGPTAKLLGGLVEGVSIFLQDFLRNSMRTGSLTDDSWATSWPIFYWCAYLAWGPLSGIFLGTISKGYTVREALLYNWILPGVFIIIWLSVLSGTSIFVDTDTGGYIWEVINDPDRGVGYTLYAVVEKYPARMLFVFCITISLFLSFVTAADSNTSAISRICTKTEYNERGEGSLLVKIVVGILVAMVAYYSSIFGGDGVKQTGYIGGAIALVIEILIVLSAWQIIMKPKKFFLQ